MVKQIINKEKKMILHLGKNTVIRDNDIIGLFDMDTATTKEDTKRFIRKMEKEKKNKYN
jgi:hypothetical protein